MPEYSDVYSRMSGLGKYEREELARRGLTEADSHFLFNLEDKGRGSSRPGSSASGEQRLRELGFIEPTTEGLRRTSEAGARFVDLMSALGSLSSCVEQERSPEAIRSAEERVGRAREALDGASRRQR